MALAKAALCLTLVLALSACGGGDDSESPAAAGPSNAAPSASPGGAQQPASGEWTMAEAGQQYLAMVGPGNKLTDRLKKLLGDESDDLSAIKDACSNITEEWFTLLGKLQQGHWPSQVQDEVDDFIKQIARERSHYSDCAEADDLNEALNSLIELHDVENTAPTLLRSALGLPAAK
jgi:hypothetical protein